MKHACLLFDDCLAHARSLCACYLQNRSTTASTRGGGRSGCRLPSHSCRHRPSGSPNSLVLLASTRSPTLVGAVAAWKRAAVLANSELPAKMILRERASNHQSKNVLFSLSSVTSSGAEPPMWTAWPCVALTREEPKIVCAQATTSAESATIAQGRHVPPSSAVRGVAEATARHCIARRG